MNDKEDWAATATAHERASAVKRRPILENAKAEVTAHDADSASGVGHHHASMVGGIAQSSAKYERETLLKALEELKNGRDASGKKVSVRTTAEKYSVPKSTLHRHLKCMLISEEPDMQAAAMKEDSNKPLSRQPQATSRSRTHKRAAAPGDQAVANIDTGMQSEPASDGGKSAESGSRTTSSDTGDPTKKTIRAGPKESKTAITFITAAAKHEDTPPGPHLSDSVFEAGKAASSAEVYAAQSSVVELPAVLGHARMNREAPVDTDVRMVDGSGGHAGVNSSQAPSWPSGATGSQGANASLLYRLRAEDHYSRPNTGPDPSSGSMHGRPGAQLPPPQRGHYRSTSIHALPHHHAQDVSFSSSMAPLYDTAAPGGISAMPNSSTRDRESKRHGAESESTEHHSALHDADRFKHRKVHHAAGLMEPSADSRADRLSTLEVEIERVKVDMTSMQNRLASLEQELSLLRRDSPQVPAALMGSASHPRAPP